MLSVSEAQQRILSHFEPVEAQTLPLEQSAGRVLAQDIFAAIDLPLFDNSAVDGFALHASDLERVVSAGSITLPVIADIPAGSSTEITLQSGQAARIMTGAPVPEGAEAVVMVEDTDFNDRAPGTPVPKNVTVYKPAKSNTNIRQRGEDMRTGTKVLSRGQRLRPQDLGLLAMLGVATVPVHRRPRLALLSSGDELIPLEATLTPGKVRDSNTYTLSAQAAQSGVEVVRLGVAADERLAVQSMLERAVAEGVDVIVSSAGVSVGAFDFIKDVVEEQGSLDFWKVNMRPGKPLAFGHYQDIPFFGLPGNPVSAFIGFEVFVRPALEKLGGAIPQPLPRQRARLAGPVNTDGRETYLRAVVTEENGTLVARLTGHQGSGNLLSLVQANALLIVPSGVKSLPANAEAEVWML
jgi:molybdopterin molybdotransferase